MTVTDSPGELIETLRLAVYESSLTTGEPRAERPGTRRINIQHRLVYEVLPDEGVVHILRMWTHYE